MAAVADAVTGRANLDVVQSAGPGDDPTAGRTVARIGVDSVAPERGFDRDVIEVTGPSTAPVSRRVLPVQFVAAAHFAARPTDGGAAGSNRRPHPAGRRRVGGGPRRRRPDVRRRVGVRRGGRPRVHRALVRAGRRRPRSRSGGRRRPGAAAGGAALGRPGDRLADVASRTRGRDARGRRGAQRDAARPVGRRAGGHAGRRHGRVDRRHRRRPPHRASTRRLASRSRWRSPSRATSRPPIAAASTAAPPAPSPACASCRSTTR